MAARILAIGDIHGCLTQFDALLQSVVPTLEDRLVLLGDYVDRGLDASGVVKRILKLSSTYHVTALKGNHEQMMLAARVSHDRYSDWIQNGGHATLRSYAGIRGTLRDVPADHWHFLETQLVDYLENDTHIFVHASARPDLEMPDQPNYILRWERFDNVTAHESGKVIVCGHTPQSDGRPLNKGFAVCLDTNAYAGGLLTCMDVASGRIWQAEANGSVQRSHISDFSKS